MAPKRRKQSTGTGTSNGASKKAKVTKVTHRTTKVVKESDPEPEPEPGFPRFAELPEKVRKRIYYHMGLYRPCAVHLHNPNLGINQFQLEAAGEEVSDTEPHSKRNMHEQKRCLTPEINGRYFSDMRTARLCLCPPFPTAIFQVSKAIGKEAESFFYKHNRFAILRRLDLALVTLRGISESALSKIHILEVDVGQLTNSDFRKRNSLHAQLEELCHLMSKAMTMTQMEFVFKCDISGLRAQARDMFIEAFSPVHGLKRCLILLEPSNKTSYVLWRAPKMLGSREYFGDIAQSLVDNLTRDVNKPANPKPFRYYDLPKELRLMVLSHTTLVASPQELCRGLGFRISAKKIIRGATCCGTCSSSTMLTTTDTYYGPGTVCCPAPVCCCFGQRSVASSTCTCERSPKALFLVDKLTNMEAREVYLSHNRFINYGPPRQALRFFRSAPEDTIRAIRYLDLSYQPHDTQLFSYWGFQSSSTVPQHFEVEQVNSIFWSEFVDLLDYLQNFAVLGSLELTIRFLTAQYQQHSAIWARHAPLPGGDYLVDLKAKMKDVGPVLSGLKAFKVFSSCACLDETALEKAAMGPSYDSTKYGKLDRLVRHSTIPYFTTKEVEEMKEQMKSLRIVPRQRQRKF